MFKCKVCQLLKFKQSRNKRFQAINISSWHSRLDSDRSENYPLNYSVKQRESHIVHTVYFSYHPLAPMKNAKTKDAMREL